MAGLTDAFGFIKFVINGTEALAPTKEAVEELGKYLEGEIENAAGDSQTGNAGNVSVELSGDIQSRQFISGASASYVPSNSTDPAQTALTLATSSVAGTAGTPVTVYLPAAEVVSDVWNLDSGS